jgi:hypothetical protein
MVRANCENSFQVSQGVFETAANFDDTVKVPYIVAETDTGQSVHALVTSAPIGRYLSAYREVISLGDLTRTWERVNGVRWSVRRTTFAAIGMKRAKTFAFVGECGHDSEVVHAKDVSRSSLSFIPQNITAFATLRRWLR